MARATYGQADHSRLPDVLEFMQTLWAMVHGLERISKRMANTIGITGPQRLTLRVIGLFPGISAGELADILRIHPSTLTGILQRLATRGLIVRAAGAGDRRLALLRLTPAGLRANRNSRGTAEAVIAAALRGCNGREVGVARRVLARVSAQLELKVAAEDAGSDRGGGPTKRPRRPR